MTDVGAESATPGIGTLIAALLIPPLGVWLARGIGPAFWVSLLLTVFAFLPGMVFALLIVFTPALMPATPR